MQKVIKTSSLQESRPFTNDIESSNSNKSNAINYGFIKELSLGNDSVATINNGYKIVLSDSTTYVKTFADKVKIINKIIINNDVLENEDFINEILKEAAHHEIDIKRIIINVIISTEGRQEPNCTSINQRLYQKILRLITLNHKTLKSVALKFNCGNEIFIERGNDGSTTNLIYGYDSSFGVFSKLIYPLFKAFKAGNSKAFNNFSLTLNISQKESLHLQRIFQALLDVKQRSHLSSLSITSPYAVSSTFIIKFIKDTLSTVISYKKLTLLTFNFPQYNDNLENITTSLQPNGLINCNKIINANEQKIIFL
uniref:Kinesin motor domain-containing protein n=1 Tax=Parastrongyloides trichosuri TaxID=131310 RepID=A0A0N4Z1Q5_PARTI